MKVLNAVLFVAVSVHLWGGWEGGWVEEALSEMSARVGRTGLNVHMATNRVLKLQCVSRQWETIREGYGTLVCI